MPIKTVLKKSPDFTGKPTVHCLRGEDRRLAAEQALKSLRLPYLNGSRVVVKPNVVSAKNPLACTHPDTLDAVLEFFTGTDAKEVIVAEGSFGGTIPTMRELGLYDVCERYAVEMVDLNHCAGTLLPVVKSDLSPRMLRCASLPLEPDVLLVSLALLKTHDFLLATLGLKNVVMGSLQKRGPTNDKAAVHDGGHRLMHLNIFLLSRQLSPDVTLLDGVVGMEGDGPVRGDPVPLGVTLASTDWLAADLAGLKVMGIPRGDVGYLEYAYRQRAEGKRGFDFRVEGDRLPRSKPFRLHSNCETQLAWKRV